MRIVTPEQMRRIDKRAIEEFGIPGIVLMENAALQSLNILENLYPNARRVLILAGGGNNGGDGLALARLLFTSGKKVRVLFFGDEDKLPSDAKTNLEIVKNLQILLAFVNNSSKEDCALLVHESLAHSDLVVDALFGTGFSKSLEGQYKTAVEIINDKSVLSVNDLPIVSLDIPSGVNGENGNVKTIAVKATDTIAFGYTKFGHLLYPGKMFAGKLHIVPIGLPPLSAEVVGDSAFTLTPKEAAMMLKKRLPWGHKGTFGKTFVIAGSTGMTGAACLTGMASLKTGSGIVSLAVPRTLNIVFEQKLTEIMTVPVEDTGMGAFSRNCVLELMPHIKNSDVLAIGPGIGKGEDIMEVLKYVFDNFSTPIVLDADGLNCICENLDILSRHEGQVVITPHPGEMSRLTGNPIREITANPIKTALEFAQKYSAIVLLKGAVSVVADPSGALYVNRTGNEGMATAGSGDVLTGIVAGFVSQGYDAFDAAVLASFLHGFAGDIASEQIAQDSITASDILNNLPFALKKLRNFVL